MNRDEGGEVRGAGWGEQRSKSGEAQGEEEGRDWALFLFYVAVIGIVAITLFPFRLYPEGKALLRELPFWDWFFEEKFKLGHFLENILLFAPFGFALGWRLEKKTGRIAGLLSTTAVSFVFTFGIELTQKFMAGRTSSWVDIAANTMGGAAGWLALQALREPVRRVLDGWIDAVYGVLSARLLLGFVAVYSVGAILITVPLSQGSKLSDWLPAQELSFGNLSGGDGAWRGRLYEFCAADRYFGPKEARRVFQEGFAAVAGSSLIADYLPKNGERASDLAGQSPTLDWTPGIAAARGAGAEFTNGGPWLRSNGPADALSARIPRADRFSLYVKCETTRPLQPELHAIVGLGKSVEASNFVIGQYFDSLTLRWRSPLNERGTRRAEYFEGRFFDRPGEHAVLFTYDGARVYFYADGKEGGPEIEAGPGALLESKVRWPRGKEMVGYKTLYYAAIFVPIGLALGVLLIVAPRTRAITVICGLLLPGCALEPVARWAGHRPFYLSDLTLAAGMAAAGLVFAWRLLPRPRAGMTRS